MPALKRPPRTPRSPGFPSRALGLLVPATVALVVATCKLDKLITPPSSGLLSLSPASLSDSAPLGSTAPRARAVAIANTGNGRLAWTAATAQGGAWLSLSAASGTAPETLTVTLDPGGLAAADYRDTVIVTATGSSAGQLRVPVLFRVQPCGVIPITIGAPVTGSLSAAACAAPHRPGHAAQLFSFSGAAGDSITLELSSAAVNAYLILDSVTTASVPPVATNDDCPGAGTNACLPYQRLLRSGTFVVEATSSAPASYGDFALLLSRPRLPAAPDSLAQLLGDSATVLATGATTAQAAVVLRGVLSDPDRGDSLRLEAEVRPLSVAFTGTATVSGSAVANGQRALVRVALADDSSYHWRARAVDQTGRGGPWTPFGGNAEGATDFHVAVPQAPLAPGAPGQFTRDSVTSLAVGGVVDTAVVVLKAVVSDPDPGDQLRLQVEVRPVGTAFANAPTDSSAVRPADSTAAVRVAGLSDGVGYHWQARAMDQTGRPGPWASFGGNTESAPDFTVRIAHPPAVPTGLGQFQNDQVTAIAVGGTSGSGTVVFKATLSDPDATDSLRLGVEIQPVGTAFTNAASGSSVKIPNGGVATVTISGLADNTAYHWQARATDITNRTSPWVNFGNNLDTATDLRVALLVDSLAFGTQPVTTAAGAAITPAVTVTALTKSGLTVTSFTGTVTIALGTNPGGAALSGTRTVTAVAGVATFSDLSLDKVASGYTLQAAVGSVTATSSGFAVTPGPAASLVFSVQPLTAIAGAAITPAPQVTARDAFGNTATEFTGNVAVTLVNATGAALSGRTTVAAVAGVARFDSLMINKAGTGYALNASATGPLGPIAATSAAFDVTASTANRLAFTVQPSTVAAGAAITPAVQVTARDSLGNKASTFSGTVTISFGTNAGGGTLSGTTSVVADSGVATFLNLHVDKAGAGYTLTASSPATGSSESAPFTVTPGTATQLAFTVQPSSATAGAAIGPAVQVTARDAQGNTATGFGGLVTVAIVSNPGGSTLGGTASVSAVSGVATFGDLSLDKVGTGYTLSAAAAGLAGATSAAFNVTPGAATQLGFTVQPTNTTAGAAVSPAVQVTARDAHGNAATGFSGSVTIALGANPGGGALSGDTSVAAVNGVATFGSLSVNKADSGYTLTAASGGLAGATSGAFAIHAGPASALFFTGQPSATTAGAAITPAVQVTARDAFGNTAPGFTQTVTINIGANPSGGVLAGVASVAASGGVATFAGLSIDKAGPGYTLTASASGITGATSASFDVTPGAASKLVFSVQPSAVTAGAAIAPAVQVTAQDAQGNTDPSFTDTVTVAIGTNGGGGTLSGTTKVAAAQGVATFSGLSIDKAGTGYTLTAVASGATGTTSVAFTVTAGPATQLVFSGQPASTSAGSVLTPAVQVTAKDAQGNVATSFTSDVTIAILANPGGSTLSGTTTIAAVAGVATFGNLSLNKTGSNYTLSAGSGALPAATSAPFNITPASAKRVVFTVQPTGATAGATITPAVQVVYQDTLGNTDATFGGNVTAAIGNGPLGATLGGTTTVAAVNGVATFSDLSITKAGAGYTLTAAASGAATGASAAFTIAPGAAAKLAFTQQPTTVAADAAIAPAVQVTARDAFGNTATSFTGSVAVAIGSNPGGSTLGGATSATAASGVAAFSTLTLNKTGTGYTLIASAAGVASDTSATFAVTPGSAASLAFTVQPDTVTAGHAISPALQVTAFDAQGNVATGFTGTVTAAIGVNAGGSTLSGTLATAASGGVATFTNLILNKVGTGYTLTANAAGVTGAASAPFRVTPDSAHHLVFTVQPSSVVAGAVMAPAVVVTALDASGNTATGFTGSVTVALGTNPSNALMTGTKIVAAVGGVATFSTLRIDKVGAGYTLLAAAPGLISGGSTTFNVTPAPAAQLVFTAQPATTVAGAALPTVQVTARDTLGNTDTNFGGSVTVAITGGTGTAGAALRGTKTVAAVGGVASFPGLSIDSAGTGYTLTAAAGGLAGAASAGFAITAGAATHLVFAVQPAATVAGAAISPAIKVAAKDSVGNTDPAFTSAVTVAIGTNAGGGTLAGTPSAPAVSGVATFSGLSIDKSGAGYTLVASGVGTPVTSAAFTITPGAAAQLVFSVEPSSATAGAAISPAVQVTAQDGLGNTATAFAGSVTVAIGTNPGGGTLAGTGTVAATAGVATFSTLSIDKAGAGYTLTATSGALTPASSAPFTIGAGAAAAIAATGGNAQTDTIGATLGTPYSVKITDAHGNAVGGVTVTWAVAGSGSITPSSISDGAGVASASRVLGTTAGNQSATAAVTGLTGSPVAFTAIATHGNATTIAKHGGDAQSATVSSPVPVAPSALVTDRGGNPVPSVAVTFAATASNGSVSPTTAIPTDAGGIAQVTSWTLSATAKPDTLTATSAGLTNSPLVFTATAFSGSATTMALNGGDAQTDTIGATLAVQYSVLVTDILGNPVGGVPVSWAAASGSITASSLTDGSGIARATRVLGATAGTQGATAAVGGLGGSPVTFTATATHGNASTMSLAGGNAQSDTIGATLGTPYSVLVTDRGSNPVGGVTVSWAATGGGGSITASSLTNGSGIAAATRTLGDAAGTQTASATAAGLTGSPVSFAATATAGTATTVALAGGNNQTDTIGATLPIPYTVRVTDRAANPVAGVAVGWAVSGGGAITPSSNTDASGIASATRVLGTTVGAQGATATAAGLAGSPVAFTATATSGGAKNIALSAGDAQTDTIGATLATPLRVLVTDAAGNPVSGVTVSWAGTGGASVSAPSSVTAGSGTASVLLTLGSSAGTQGATATATGLTGSPVVFTATAAHGNASQIAASAGDGQSATAGSAVAIAPAVGVRDRGGNPVSGVAVTFAVTAGGGTVDPVGAVTTDVGGVAAVTSWTLGTAAGANTLTATSTGLSGSPLVFTATGTAGPATQIALNAGNGQTATVGTAVATAPSVIVRDQFNNPVAGVPVTFAVVAGGGTVVPVTPVVTGATGLAAATSWTLGSVAGADTLSAAATGLAGSPVMFGATATPGAVSGAVSTVSASPATIAASSGGSTSTITVTAKDQFGNPVSGVTVALVATGTGNTLIQPGATDVSGKATGTLSSTRAEAKTVSATVNATPVTQTAVVTVEPAAASADSSHVVASPTSITASSGGTVSTITVTSRDGFGNPRVGDGVVLAATGTGNTIVQPASTTDATGVTTGTLSSTKAEVKTVSATINGSVLVAQTASVTVVAGSTGVRLKFVVPPATTVASAVITPAVQVAEADSFGNTVSAGARPNITLAIANNPNAGTLAGTLTVQTAGGGSPRISTFSNLSINHAGLGYTLRATSGTLVPDTSPPFDIKVAASLSTVASSAGQILASTTTSATITVTAKDTAGNPLSGVTVVLSATGSGNTLTQPVATTNLSGVATGTLSSTVAESKTISATLNGLALTHTVTVTVLPAGVSATHSSVAAAPDTITASSGSSLSTITVTARDQFDNPVSGTTVSLSATGSGNTLTQPVGTTNSAGQITGALSSTAAGTKTVSALIAGAISVTQTASVVVTPGAATHLGFTAQPTTATAGQAISPAVVVTALDNFGNTDTSFNLDITVAITALTGDSGATLSGTRTVTAAAGVATFSTLSIDSAGTGYTLSATGGALPTATSTTFDIVPGAVAQLVWSQEPTATAVNTAISPNPSLRALDALGNLVSTFTGSVTMAIATKPGTGALGGDLTVNAIGGIATFANLTIDTAGDGYTLQATTGSVTSTPSASFSITP